MSKDRTVVPGISGAESNGSLYSRSTKINNGSAGYRGTVVPGMTGSIEPQEGRRATAGVPIIGFLYSISRQGIGEYWPIQIGKNKIGRDASNDVVLSEQTVSGEHASISVKKLKNGKVIAMIRDEGSKTGIYVNDEELEYADHECKNGDIIKIGEHYQFLFILINAEEIGLSVCEDFQPADSGIDEVEEEVEQFRTNGQAGGFNPYDHNNRGTVAMDGTMDSEGPSGTRFL